MQSGTLPGRTSGVEESLDCGGTSALSGHVERVSAVGHAGLEVRAMLEQDRDPSGVAGACRGMLSLPE